MKGLNQYLLKKLSCGLIKIKETVLKEKKP